MVIILKADFTYKIHVSIKYKMLVYAYIFLYVERRKQRQKQTYKVDESEMDPQNATGVDRSEFDFVPKYTTCINCKIKSMNPY